MTAHFCCMVCNNRYERGNINICTSCKSIGTIVKHAEEHDKPIQSYWMGELP